MTDDTWGKAEQEPPLVRDNRPTMLLRVTHGLGDSCQATILLRHLRHFYPQYKLIVQCNRGHADIFRGLADEVELAGWPWRHKSYTKAIYVTFPRSEHNYNCVPSTKAAESLYVDFRDSHSLPMQPVESFFYYDCESTNEQFQQVDKWVATLPPDAPILLIHHEGNSSRDKKDLTVCLVRKIAKEARARGWLPVMLHWGGQHNLVTDGLAYSCLTEGQPWSEAGLIRAVIDRANLFLCIDSGPAHIAATTDTETLVIWKGFHPIYNFDLADNVLHLVPFWSPVHNDMNDDSRAYFKRAYRSIGYAVEADLLDTIYEGL
jgi:ADP-heptose:LPS heptosyltransferase